MDSLNVYSRFTNIQLEGTMFISIGSIYYQNSTVEGLSKSEPKSVGFIYKRSFFYFQWLIV